MNNQDQDQTIDMLDETLDDLADMPASQPFPAGAHACSMKVRRNPKKAGNYVVELIHQTTVELSNPAQQEPSPGDKSTVFISTKKKDGTVNEFGQGQLKIILTPIGAMLGTSSINEILEATQNGIDVIAVVGIRKSKDEQYDDQQDIKKVELAD